jgi:hypothetical protein
VLDSCVYLSRQSLLNGLTAKDILLKRVNLATSCGLAVALHKIQGCQLRFNTSFSFLKLKI